MTTTPEPLDRHTQPPNDRYCDLVLTGGLTDGVVYPWAVLELARAYRFKNIGGTSVGAMAAALTAAAEYARRHGHLTGFNEVLLKLPGRLAETKKPGGKTKLYSLFQPAPKARRLFDLFVRFFNGGGLGAATASYSQDFANERRKKFGPTRRTFDRAGKIFSVLGSLYVVYWLAALIGGAVGLLILFALLCWIGVMPEVLLQLLLAHNLAALCLALVAAGLGSLIAIALHVYWDLLRGLVANGFGLCNGGHEKDFPREQESLVEWLHLGIQAAARRSGSEPPLTFKDLWDAPGGPSERVREPAQPQRQRRSIDLRMVTTNLTHGRPYALPLGGLNVNTGEYDRSSRLFFKLSELEPYFPPRVMQHLKEHSKPYERVEYEDPVLAQIEDVKDFLELPQGELPVVVAARLSLSFPVLFSTVPLWAIDYEAPPEKRTLRRCGFSDGGICSNFPIHLFDAAVPGWPTFGIWLAPKNVWRDPKKPAHDLWLPKFHYDGRGDGWNRFDDAKSVVNDEKIPALDRLVGFVFSIIYGAKDWNDRTTLRLPGVRDRVLRVFLGEEGQGLNLEIKGERILALAERYGQRAGAELVKEFAGADPDGPPSRKWNEHRWVRFNTFLVGLRERIEALRAAAERAHYCMPLPQQIAKAREEPPLEVKKAKDDEPQRDPEKTLSPAQADELTALLAALEDLELRFAQAQLQQPYQPRPTPSLHLRPPV